MVVGLDDIRAVRFRCKKCGATVSLTDVNGYEVPFNCVACHAEFRSSSPISRSPLAQFSETLLSLRKFPNDKCELLFEFDEPYSVR